MLILHQAGHNTVWNLNSYEKNKVGDGIILSPVHLKIDKINDLNLVTRNKSYFDPQFYVPDSQKKNLNSYHFFPEKITDGFSTTDFAAVAYDAAQLCIEFQIANEFKGLVIPARYFNDMLTDYIKKQQAFSVEPFLSYIKKNNIKKDVFITLALTSAMIGDEKYRHQLLNWVTSYQEITGVYLLINFNETTKQVCDITKLTDYLEFIHELSEADLKVICGYCNTEAILCALREPFAITIGAYENTRKFSIDKFLEDDSEVRGPAPRLYLPKLLNWVRYDTIMEIREDFPTLWNNIYTPTEYSEIIFNRGTRPHFTQPELYYHYFILINRQLNEIASKTKQLEKINIVQKWVEDAHQLYTEIQNKNVLFSDVNCKGEHLPVWNRILRKIRQQQ